MTTTEQALSREEIAKLEIGRTETSRGVKGFLVVLFLSVVAFVPILQNAAETRAKGLSVHNLPQCYDVLALHPTKEDLSAVFRTDSASSVLRAMYRTNARLLQGIAGYETALEDQSVYAQRVIPAMGSILVGALRAGNEEVYCGREGWLFYRPGIDYLTGRGFLAPEVLAARAREGNEWTPPPQPNPVEAIVEFRNQLAERGIELIVLPAPAKAMVYPERFSARYEDVPHTLQNPSYQTFRQQLEATGVRLFDPTPILLNAKATGNSSLYLETDTHWSPEGMELVARHLAAYVNQSGLLPRRDPLRYACRTEPVENLGDIATMLQLPRSQSFYKPVTVAVRPVAAPSGEPWSPRRDADVLLLGDSFANVFSLDAMGWGSSAGLAEQLSYELQRPVDTIIINDNGAFATRRRLSQDLRKGIDRLAGKKLVIYEFAMRELAVGDWRLGLDLTLGALEGPVTRVPQAGHLIVRGTVRAVSKPPRPGSVPYKDCIVALHLTAVQPVQGTLEEDEIVVFTWGMRDNKLQPASEYDPGQQLTLPLTPWDEAERKYGGYNRVELEDDDLLWLDVFWAGDARDRPSAEPAVPAEPLSPAPPTVPESRAPSVASVFLEDLAAKAAHLEDEGRNTLIGKDGWLFFGPELRSLSVGPFWGKAARDVSRASNPEWADPLPAIVDFHAQLAGAGIDLLVVPVPAKAAIYPEMASDTVQAGPGEVPPRLDLHHQAFYEVLREEGVKVLDLTPLFLERRVSDEIPLYCRQDTHWSGHACAVAASAMTDSVRTAPWFQDVPKKTFLTEAKDVEISGDLWGYLADATVPKETVAVTLVSEDTSTGSAPVESWRDSPVLLLGDSHCLVFHAGGDMHAQGAGLPDLLALELGFPVDLVAVRGSGATPARISLLRRRDNLAGKRLVIWCFAGRDVTESFDGWRPLPVIRDAE